MDYRSRITVEPGKRSGKPCIRGLRITVYDILDYLAGGMTEEQVLADFPDLERDDIRAVLAFAADRERRLVSDPAAQAEFVPSLLFDENLSPHLPRLVAEVFAGGLHVRDVGLARADDSAVWEHARTHGLAIVTKDDDFRQRSFLYGSPPKVIWVHLGNCRTADVQALLMARAAGVRAFLDDPTASLLVLQRQE